MSVPDETLQLTQSLLDGRALPLDLALPGRLVIRRRRPADLLDSYSLEETLGGRKWEAVEINSKRANVRDLCRRERDS